MNTRIMHEKIKSDWSYQWENYPENTEKEKEEKNEIKEETNKWIIAVLLEKFVSSLSKKVK